MFNNNGILMIYGDHMAMSGLFACTMSLKFCSTSNKNKFMKRFIYNFLFFAFSK
ncbi:hypothetical protein GLOIN_2v831163 [Rhizophagus irregularis DAOM 181602=DAOM 197198]|uniref:Zona-pellucida-binding protein 1/2 N-terminal domain-containing protein n=1 Tax=Rhizophagus irregularis (strain DAOM 181602 / DAOM 197198 / MUCL 43194) TaxID=747089 RepID=A0A2P4QHE4_RHIID|nr:hypothetical protein GLOIN_2v831163 [Rhizophagus irregularis DAOM 181602=DAOM 197198]POG77040.1 hypothetical protein GLOIN_2v831163 [Rhizophagus irregularis DAOM 181602=DAOM 197198]|eukprot:XP_025183906.1 hypothetical protein GLOIN_2v831163 [Rhizophagus irregularis DAOM 181602=DAOM 197198]